MVASENKMANEKMMIMSKTSATCHDCRSGMQQKRDALECILVDII